MIQENANTEEAGAVLMWQMKQVACGSVLWSKKKKIQVTGLQVTDHLCESKLG